MFLTITGENGTARIKTEYAIRNILKPVKAGQNDVILQLKDRQRKNKLCHISKCFYCYRTTKTPENELESITIYGGGNGHRLQV